MRYVVGLMVIVFFLTGLGLFISGARGLILRLSARRRLQQVQGEIIRIEQRQKDTDSDSGRASMYDYPEIRFRGHQGDVVTFLSEIGAGSRAARYAVGQKIGVRYDPAGEIPPMIDSWAGIWLTPLLHAFFGPVFIGVAVFLCWAFGDKILGR